MGPVDHLWAASDGTVTVPRWFLDVLAGVIGLVVGSFANVVIYRTPRHLSVVRPPSFCPQCSTPIRGRDNIPVISWLALRGRCRTCGAPIAVRYPLVEAGAGVLFVLLSLASGPRWSVFGLCALGGTLGVSAVIELDNQEVPQAVSEIGAALGLAGLAGAAGVEHHWTRFAGAAVGALLAALLSPVLRRWAQSVGRPSGERWWALVPAGAMIGWSGPVGAATGVGVLCLAVLALPGDRRPSQTAATGVSAGDGRVRRRLPSAAGPVVAAAVAAAVAVIAALGAGSPLG